MSSHFIYWKKMGSRKIVWPGKLPSVPLPSFGQSSLLSSSQSTDDLTFKKLEKAESFSKYSLTQLQEIKIFDFESFCIFV